jgi:hypothetical protein
LTIYQEIRKLKLLTSIARQIQKVYFRLPDGGYPNGAGYSVTGSQSLELLYFGAISSISAIDGTATYSKATLSQAIKEILLARMPDTVRTMNYLSSYDDGDHSVRSFKLGLSDMSVLTPSPLE